MKTQPLVSILLITMNHEKFIEQACRSAVSQTYQQKEIIFLDNCSSDKTAVLGEKVLKESDVAYTIINNSEAAGVSKNLNRMVEKASGDYIVILSGDDWWAENLIEEKVKFVQKVDCDFVFSDGFKYHQETGEMTPAYDEKKKKQIINTLPNFFAENVVENQTVNVGTFIRRSLVLNHPFDEDIQTEDWDMNLRMTHLGYKPAFLDQKLFFYRILPTSLSRKWDIMSDSFTKVTDKYLSFIEADPVLKKNYSIKQLFFRYQILLSKAESDEERKILTRNWKKEKYKLIYKQPVLFFKNLLLR